MHVCICIFVYRVDRIATVILFDFVKQSCVTHFTVTCIHCKVLILVIDACASSPCQNGANCSTSQLDTYSCDCLTGYTGHNCETGKSCHYHLTVLYMNISQRDSSDVLIESTLHSTQRRQGTLWCIQEASGKV